MLEQELEHVLLGLLRDQPPLLGPLREPHLLLLQEGGGIDVGLHVALAPQAGDLPRLLLLGGPGPGPLPLLLALDEVRVVVDEVLQAQAGVDEVLHRLQAVAVDVGPDPGGVVGHVVDHPAVGLAEPVVVLEEVGVAEDVGHDQLLLHRRVRLHEVGANGVVVDDQLVDLGEAVGVALAELLVLHPEAPVGVAGGEAPVARHLVELVVIQNLEHDVVEVEAVFAGVALDLPPPAVEVGVQVHRGSRGSACPPPRGPPRGEGEGAPRSRGPSSAPRLEADGPLLTAPCPGSA